MNARGLLFVVFLLIAVVVVALILSPNTPLFGNPQLADDLVDLTVETAEGTADAVTDVLDRLLVTPRSAIIRALLIVGGILLLVAGWRIYDYVIIVAGMIVGATLALSLIPSDSPVLTIGIIIVGGVIGALLGAFLFYAAVFIVGAYIGIVLTGAIVDALSTAPISPVILLIGGIIGGLILLGLSFQFLVVISAIVGAQMLTLGLGLSVIWTLVFAVIGIIVQVMLMRNYNYSFRRRRRRVLLFG